MPTRDFTLRIYRELLIALKDAGIKFATHADYAAGRLPNSRHVLLRHDVDRIPSRAVAMAYLEHEIGAKATYYFRTHSVSFDPDKITKILNLGHEIGYHYENLADCRGDAEAAWNDFQHNLKRFASITDVQTIAMHGRPLSRWDNRDLWNRFDYRDVGIQLEPYFDIDWQQYTYFTDTGRAWNSQHNIRDKVASAQPPVQSVKTTDELIEYAQWTSSSLVISAHPERWTNPFLPWLLTLLLDRATNLIKRLVAVFR